MELQELINSCAKSAWYARRQHSYNICKDFLSHKWTLEWKNLNFTKKYTDHKTINSNNCDVWSELAKEFSIYSATYEKSPTIWWILSIPITMRSSKWIGRGVLNLQCDIQKIAYNLMNKVPQLWNETDGRTVVYHNTSRLKDGRIKTKESKFHILALISYPLIS